MASEITLMISYQTGVRHTQWIHDPWTEELCTFSTPKNDDEIKRIVKQFAIELMYRMYIPTGHVTYWLEQDNKMIPDSKIVYNVRGDI